MVGRVVDLANSHRWKSWSIRQVLRDNSKDLGDILLVFGRRSRVWSTRNVLP